MEYVLKDFEPRLPLDYFEEISAIPRGSGNEKAGAAYIAGLAKELGLWVKEDAAHNVLVKKAATPGCEHLEPILLQSHIDMVAAKEEDSDHDWLNDGLELIVDGNILRANKTTLGADDARGLAMMLALMDVESDSFNHPPLEFLFTTGEEVGFTGAEACELYDDIVSRKMINIDAGPEGRVAVSAAGAVELNIFSNADTVTASGEILMVSVTGLQGGHSGMKITDEKANANKVLGRILFDLWKQFRIRLCSIEGGVASNVIPMSAKAVIAVDPALRELALEAIAVQARLFKEEFKVTDPGITIMAESCSAETMLNEKSTEKAIRFLFTVSNGVFRMSKEIQGLPVTSSNLGIVSMEDGQIRFCFMVRSALISVKDELVNMMVSIAKLCEMDTIDVGHWLGSWPYKADSNLRQKAMALYLEEYGKEMSQLAGHAGLEVGVFTDRIPEVDVIAIGPTCGNQHTPKEWMDLDSFARVYDYLKKLIMQFAQ